MSTKLAIESLSMDLLRAALGLHRGSKEMAKRFEEEALKRSQEIESTGRVSSYLKTLIAKTNKTLKTSSSKKADELLMYSVLFKNLIQSQYPLQ